MKNLQLALQVNIKYYITHFIFIPMLQLLIDNNLLQNKEYKEYIQDYDVRKKNVEEYCNKVKPEVICNIQRLTDIAGPAGTDPTIQAILVTTETYKSVPIINEIRKKNNLDPIECEVIDLVKSNEEMRKIKDDIKVSSTTIRKYLADKDKAKNSANVEM